MIALGNFAERRVGTRAALIKKPRPKDR